MKRIFLQNCALGVAPHSAFCVNMFCAAARGCVASAYSATGSETLVAGAGFRTFACVARRKSTLCGDRARRSALAVVPCECVHEGSQPSAQIVRVEALSLVCSSWTPAQSQRVRTKLAQSALPQLRLEICNF